MPAGWRVGSVRFFRGGRFCLAGLKGQSLEEVVILSQERGISNELLEVIKEGCLKMLHDKISFVLSVSVFHNATYTIAKTEEIARK